MRVEVMRYFSMLLVVTISVSLLLSCSNPSGQDNDNNNTTTAVNWLRTFGNGAEQAMSIAKTNDGYVAGGSVYTGSLDWPFPDSILIIKTDLMGNLVWRKTHSSGRGKSIVQTASGQFAIAGTLRWQTAVAGADTAMLMILDNGGNLITRKTYGPGALQAVCRSSDNGFILTGELSENVLVIKTDGLGNQAWSKTYGGAGSESAQAIVPTNNGGCVIAGRTSVGAGGRDIYLLKLDASGDVVFEEMIGGSLYDAAMGLASTGDGGYLICGESEVMVDAQETDLMYVVKTDSDGKLSWQKTYGTDEGILYGCAIASNGGYVLTGYGRFDANNYDLVALKIDNSGNQTWLKVYSGGQDELGYGIVSTADGGCVITGKAGAVSSSPGNVLMIKTDASGIW